MSTSDKQPLVAGDKTTTEADIKHFQELYLKELKAQKPSTNTKFNYAWCLIRSPEEVHIRKGINLLTELLQEGEEISTYLYFLAVAHYSLGEHGKSRKWLDILLEKDPDHPQAKSLKKDVESKITEEGLVGMAIVGGVASIIGGIAFLLMKGKK